MENYIVSARKYRPSTFASVVGQKALTATLRNSISKNRLAHSYLFCGSRGVGKTSCARIFAKTINCRHRTPQGEACNECESCREFNKGASLNIIELDAASNNGVEDIRSITDQVQIPPVNADYRVFIIDEVHMLSNQAFNAFLKTLEEPPSYAIFILATTEKHKIIPTILSRCQIYDFARITIQDMVDHLAYVASQEGVEAEPAALAVIARKADGAMRDALSIFDQVAASSMGHITYESAIENLNMLDYGYYNRLTEAFLAGDVPSTLLIYKEIRDRGFDSQFFVNGLAQHLRDLMVASNAATLPLLEAADDVKQAMAALAAKCTPKWLYMGMDLCNETDLNYRAASNKQLLVEILLIKLCQQLSPSRSNSGAAEGQLRPVATASAAQRSAAPQSVSPAVSAAAQAPAPAPSASARPHEPQRQQAPAPTPAPPPVVQAAPSATRPLRRHTHTISISGNTPAATPTAAPTATSDAQAAPRREKTFTPEQLAEAWARIATLDVREHLLNNTIRMTQLALKAPATVVATVESEAYRDNLTEATAMIVDRLREWLQNDAVTLEVVLDKRQSSVVGLTDAEALALMRERYPYLNTMIADLRLSMM